MRQVGRFPKWMAGFSKELKNDVMLRMSNGATYFDRIVLAEQEIVEEIVGKFELMFDTPGLSAVTPTSLGLSLELNGGADLGVENRVLASYESDKEVLTLSYDNLGNMGNRFVVTRALFANVGTFDPEGELDDLVEVSADDLAADITLSSDGVWILDASDVFEAKCSLVACAKSLSSGTLLGGYRRVVRKEDGNDGQLSFFSEEMEELRDFDAFIRDREARGLSAEVSEDELSAMFLSLMMAMQERDLNE